ncbi:MAG: high frequency lysogenization protein HflD [Xanthomonadales bacterium]|nr:high frequency lysogenization protein HflD [Xanthomonadales bacterium]
MKDRVLALAGLLQALSAVRQIAHEGRADAELVQPCLDSVFRLDAENVEAVYGSAQLLKPGLECLLRQIHGPGRDVAISRMAATVLHLERQLIKQPKMLDALRQGIDSIERQREHFGSEHSSVSQRLADLYADTLSQLKPRVMVQGNPLQLAQSGVVAQIRAALLAAVRSAVLWRQLGGSYWDLALRRGAMTRTARDLLQER